MITLKESILADMDDTLAQGDELDKNIKAEIKEFLKAIATAKIMKVSDIKMVAVLHFLSLMH